MTAINIRGAHSDIKVNVGCDATHTIGWASFDNSMSIRAVRYPEISSLLAKLRLIDPQSASLAGVARQESGRSANSICCQDNFRGL
jgi:hypothetical protein